MSEIAKRLANVLEQLGAAARLAGRKADAVRLVAISKYATAEQIAAAAEAGQRDFGENYVSDALAKMAALNDPALRWHMVGQLQSNKAAKAARSFDLNVSEIEEVRHSYQKLLVVSPLDKN